MGIVRSMVVSLMNKRGNDMLVKIRLTGEWAVRVGAKNQRTFRFKPGVNLLVGPNGSGKSTVIAAIMKHVSEFEREREEAEKEVPMVTSSQISIAKLDFEKDNPRTKSYFVEGLVGFQVGSMYRSHGETNREIVDSFDDNAMQGRLMLLDEPDQALDLDGVALLLRKLELCPAAQMIVSVHHPSLVLSGFNIVELEEGYCSRVYTAMSKVVHGSWRGKKVEEKVEDKVEQVCLDL